MVVLLPAGNQPGACIHCPVLVNRSRVTEALITHVVPVYQALDAFSTAQNLPTKTGPGGLNAPSHSVQLCLSGEFTGGAGTPDQS